MKKNKILSFPVAIIMILTLLSSTCLAADVSDTQIYLKWQKLGGQSGFLGAATTNTAITPNKLGVYNHFQYGSIYRKYSFSEAFEIHGLIRDKYARLGWENSFLGFPTTDECDTYNRGGRVNHFEGGSIFYKWGDPQAFETHGAIRSFYSWMGWERSPLGYPKSDEYSVNGKKASRFENGAIYYNGKNAVTTWPVLNKAKLSADGYPKLNVTLLINQFGANYKVTGSGFPANKYISVYMSRVDYAYGLTQIKSKSDGTISYNSGISYIDNMSIKKVDGVITFFARCSDGTGKIAIHSQYESRLGNPAILD